MHTPETEHETAGLGATAKSVAEHASSLVRLELELAALELKRKIASLGIGIGLALARRRAAGVRARLRPRHDRRRDRHRAPVVGGAPDRDHRIILVAALLGWLGMRSIQKGTPPVPEQAIAEAKLTTEALKGNGRH